MLLVLVGIHREIAGRISKWVQSSREQESLLIDAAPFNRFDWNSKRHDERGLNE
jgi:hypothetical protein